MGRGGARSPSVPPSSRTSRRSLYSWTINNIVSPHGNTLLSYATSQNNSVIVKFLIGNGADPQTLDKSGLSPLVHAVNNQNEDLVRVLIEAGANPNVGGPLIRAAELGDLKLCETLIELGADVNIADSTTGALPLHTAAQEGFEDIVRFLLASGADTVYKRDMDHETAALKAKRKGHHAIVKLIDLNARNKIGLTSNTINNDVNGGISVVSNEGRRNSVIDGADVERRSRNESDTSSEDIKDGEKAVVVKVEDTPDGSDESDAGIIGKGEEKYCKVCWERNRDVVMLWCGHISTCLYCSIYLQQCPICVGSIERVQKIYVP